jgi:Na+/melibiose symporter-like transporter
MISSQFTYSSMSEILSSLTPFVSMGIVGKGVFTFLLLMIVLSVLYIVPFLFAGKSYIFAEREKKKRKSMLNQIMTQKEIEDQVEREIREEETRKQSEIK